MDKKTIFIIAGILICLCMSFLFGFRILWPALDPVAADMLKIFCTGIVCGLLGGLWLGRRLEREFGKKK